MTTIKELSSDPKFLQLGSDAQQIVVDRLAESDTEFNALSPDAQSIVRQRLISNQVGVGRTQVPEPTEVQPQVQDDGQVQPQTITPTTTQVQITPTTTAPENLAAPETTTVDVPLGQGVRELREQPTSASNRAELRSAIEDLPAIPKFVIESAPAIAGTSLGFLVGLPLGSPVTGSMIGGASFEALAQEIGIAPRSKATIALSGAGAGVIPGAVKTGRAVLRGTISRFPGVRNANRVLQLEEAVLKSNELGASILSSQKGSLNKTARVLYDEASQLGARLTPEQFPNTIRALERLRSQASAVRSRPEGRQVLRDLKVLADDLGLDPQNVNVIRFNKGRSVKAAPIKGPAGFIKPKQGDTKIPLGRPAFGRPTEPVTDFAYDDLLRYQQLLGQSIKQLEKTGGFKFGASKKLFSSIEKDLDIVAKAGGKSKQAITAVRTATKRAKLEFAVKELDSIFAAQIRIAPETGTFIIETGKVLQSLGSITNPRSNLYNKNFTEALKDELPAIRMWLKETTGILEKTGLGGGLVVRQDTAQFARKVIGTALAGITGGVVGAGPGTIGGLTAGILGSQAPELIRNALLTKPGRKALTRLLKVGKGKINMRDLALASQLSTQVLLPRGDEQGIKAPPKFLGLSGTGLNFGSQ